ncbi:MAG: EF-hand domain-containing protein [Candidatus Micrarchaeaceae archaeon]
MIFLLSPSPCNMEDLKSEIAEVFRMFDEDEGGSISVNELASALYAITGEQMSREETLALMRRYDKGSSGEITLAEFEALVIERLRGRSLQDEVSRAFKLLEDKETPGFITRESLRRAAASVGEKISDAELVEMFDQLVAGHTSHAVDFATFSSIQFAAEHDASGPSASISPTSAKTV